MKLDRLTPMLWTSELKASADFYQDILGFELDEYRDEWGWCHLHKDNVTVMFAVRTEFETGKPTFTGSFYIYTEEIDALWDSLKTRTKVCYEIANFPHNMREFAIFDNNGYILQFGRDLKEGEPVTDCD